MISRSAANSATCAYGGAVADRVPQRFVHVERARRRGDPCVQSGERAPVRFVAAMRALVRRAVGQRDQFRRDRRDEGRHRQFGSERVQLLEVILEHPRRLHAQRALQHVRRHERIAVAVAADPRPDPQERGQFAQRRVRVAPLQLVLERAVQQGHFGQERLLEERQAVGHFVEHVELLEPQHAGLPQRRAPRARIDSSLAACSCGVRRVRSRACSSCSICISRSRTLLRWTSVGCAVSTGTTTPSRKNPASDSSETPAAATRSSARARLPSAGGSPSMSDCRLRRLLCRSSARLARCEK